MASHLSSSSISVTVLMPVFNGAKYLGEAIESVLGQTFHDFELLILDDGSTDESMAVVRRYLDPRIRLERNPHNLGLIATLNRGIELARGRYIARMDCDDICMPQRLERQIAFLEANPEVGVCGVWFERFGQHGGVSDAHPASHEEIREALLHVGCVIGHPTVVIRKSTLERTGLRYDPDFAHAEDYRLWTELVWKTQLHNIPEVLLRYRTHDSQVSHVHGQVQAINAGRIQASMLLHLLPESGPADRDVLECLIRGTAPRGLGFVLRARALLLSIRRRNLEVRFFRPGPLKALLGRLWYNACQPSYSEGVAVILRFIDLRLISPRHPRTWRNLAALAAWVLRSRRASWGQRRVIHLSGPFGDQLFQYAFGCDLNEGGDAPVVVDTVNYGCYKATRIGLVDTGADFRAAGPLEQLSLTRRAFHDEFAPPPRTEARRGTEGYFRGKWFSRVWADSTERRLRRELVFRGAIPESLREAVTWLEKPDSVAIHVKAANWAIADSDGWPLVESKEYFRLAWQKVSARVPHARPCVLTDHPTIVPEELGLPPACPILRLEELDDSPAAWWIMGRAKHRVISGTTFGWWLGWLNSSGMIIAPRRWAQSEEIETHPRLLRHWVPV